LRAIAKSIFFLLLLSVLASGYNTYIDHPWEYNGWKYNNSGVGEGDFEEWVWTPFVVEGSITLLKLDNITATNIDSDESSLISKAKNEKSNLDATRIKCVEEIDFIETFHEVREFRGTLTSGTAAIIPAVGLVALVMLHYELDSEEYEHAKMLEYYCSQYGKNWEKTMTHSMDALASSMDKVEKSYLEADLSYSKANHSGLCDPNYSGSGHSDCVSVGSGLNLIKGGSVEGTYGKYNLVKEDLEHLQKEVYNSRPNTGYYSMMMNGIWEENGVLDMFAGLKLKADKAFSDAEGEYNVTEYNADTKKSKVDKLFAELKSEKPNEIKTGEKIEGTIGEIPGGTISERFENIEMKKLNASLYFQDAASAKRKTGMHGYLTKALIKVKAADELYGDLEIEIQTLDNHAQDVVDQLRIDAKNKIDEAQQLVGSTPTSEIVRGHLDDANKNFKEGEEAKALGDKYKKYAEALKEAQSALTLHEQQPLDEAAQIKALRAELEQMIKDANKDGLNTFNQKATLDSIEDVNEYWVKEEIIKAQEEIIASARLEYGFLEDKRAELLKRIKLVGGEADDLIIEMQKEEMGFVDSSGKIDYRNGLGKLKALADKYSWVEEELEEVVDEIVSHSLMAEAEVFVDSVELDTPANITIDILIINTDEYESENVDLEVDLPISVDLMYSDIVQGKEQVSSVVMNGNKATLYLKEVKPFARKRIVFQTTETIAHTTKVKRSAKGLGDESAAVSEEIDFKLGSAVNSLEIPPSFENVRIDGYFPGRILSKGAHKLSARYNVEDAYNESIENVKATQIGLNSQVEYALVLKPRIDLDEVMFFVDPGAKITNLNVFTLSGESVGKKKKITQDRYSFVVSDLTAGSVASIRVSYILENSSNYIAQELALFNNTNMSQQVRTLVNQAQAAFSVGDSSTALIKIKEAKAQMKKESTETAKARKKVDSITVELKAELDEINAALSQGTSLNSSFLAKLSARADELGRRLKETAGKSPADALLDLEEVDTNWKKKEVTSFRKDIFKKYNDLKLRFADSGNTSTPDEFLDVEADLNKLEVSGRLEYVIDLLEDFAEAERLVGSAESAAKVERALIKTRFDSLKDSILDSLSDYEVQSKAAKGTEFISLFKWTEKEVEKKISDIEKIIDIGEPKVLDRKLKNLERTGRDVGDTLSLLKDQSENKLSLIQKLYNSSKEQIDEENQEALSKKIESMKRLVAAGEYVNSLRAGNLILEDIKKAKGGESNNLLLLGVTALAILGVIAAYLFKGKGGIKKEEKKELKKLEKVEEIPKTGNSESNPNLQVRINNDLNFT
jgi:hypothetical protein